MAHTTPSRIDRITSMLIPPNVFLGKHKMTEFEIIQTKLRHCHTCDRIMKYGEFIHSAHISGIRSILGLDMLKEIWENDIFVIQCCACHKGIQHGRVSDTLDAFAHAAARFTEEFRHEHEQNPLY